jgi:hypothetical protein
MKTYTLHLPRDAQPGDPEVLDRADLVKDGFSWSAFLFTFLWFLFHRLWLAGLVVLVAMLAFDVVLAALHVRPLAGTVAHLLVMLLIGFEANSVRRWTYLRRDRPVVDVVSGFDRDEAAAKAFARWLSGPVQPRVPLTRAPASAPLGSYRSGPSEPVIGLFPEPERPR